jgi:hypothetical protein
MVAAILTLNDRLRCNSEAVLSGRYGGTGLGLSLVKELVEAHHGRVGLTSCTSGPEPGTKIFLVLPVKQPKPSTEIQLIDRTCLKAEDLTPGVLQRSYSVTPQAAESVSTVEEDASVLNDTKQQQQSHPSFLKRLVKAVYHAEQTRPESDENKEKPIAHHSTLHNSFEILSVDDNAVNHVVVENSLAPKGYKITVCMDGVEALKLLEDRGYLPDLILLVRINCHSYNL